MRDHRISSYIEVSGRRQALEMIETTQRALNWSDQDMINHARTWWDGTTVSCDFETDAKAKIGASWVILTLTGALDGKDH